MAFFKPTTTSEGRPDGATDYQLHYEVIPNVLPETTFFLHGNLASNRWWAPAKDLWARRSKGQNWTGSMILAEFRGCGKSTPPKQASDVNMDVFAKDFNALVESLNLPTAPNLVGHSTGGLICALMMAAKPEFYNRMLLLDPVGQNGVEFEDSMLSAFDAMKKDVELTATVIGSTIYKNNPSTPYFREVIVKDAHAAVQSVGPWVLQALKGFKTSEKLKSVRKPTLVLHGEFDLLLPMAESMEMALTMNADFKILKGCGHCANIENPEAFVEVAHHFLFARLD